MKRNSLPQGGKTILSSWISFGGILVITALPLLNLPPWFSPPDWGKTIVFRIIFSSIIAFLVFQILFRKEVPHFIFNLKAIFQKNWRENLPFWALLSLLGIFLLATIASRDPWFSLWGDPQRSGGSLNYALYIILAIFAFLTLTSSRWNILWNVSFFVGILVSLVSIFQQFSILSDIFVPLRTQISSTLGGPWTLGIYLLLLSFLVLAYGIREKRLLKKTLYFFIFFLFGYSILLTISQAAYLGFAVGFLWFVFFLPQRFLLVKLFFGFLFGIGLLGIFFLKTNPEIPLNQQDLISAVTSWGIDQSRLSAWKVSLKALQARPILGYGPENFSVGFDTYYDPSLPSIAQDPQLHSSWWDRAHNAFLDMGLQAGVFALIISLVLFAALLWELQKVKQRNPEHAPVAHGLQAALIGYAVANFFSFDTFSTYLIFFLMAGYTMHLASQTNTDPQDTNQRSPSTQTLRIRGLGVLLIVLFVWFLWSFHIKPFQINTQINIAKYLGENNRCEDAQKKMDELLTQGNTFLDSYLRMQYVNILRTCDGAHPEKRLEYAKKGYEFLKENIEIRPSSVRNWIFLGGFTNVLLQAEINADVKNQEKIAQLAKEAHFYFEKASALSPKRQEVHMEWTKTYLITKDYEGAKQKAQECLEVYRETRECWWLLARAELSMGNAEQGQRAILQATQRGSSSTSVEALLQLANAYLASQNYPELVKIYEQLIEKKEDVPQYYGVLASAYKEVGEFKKARETALHVLKLRPEAKEEVEAFIKSLPAI